MVNFLLFFAGNCKTERWRKMELLTDQKLLSRRTWKPDWWVESGTLRFAKFIIIFGILGPTHWEYGNASSGVVKRQPSERLSQRKISAQSQRASRWSHDADTAAALDAESIAAKFAQAESGQCGSIETTAIRQPLHYQLWKHQGEPTAINQRVPETIQRRWRRNGAWEANANWGSRAGGRQVTHQVFVQHGVYSPHDHSTKHEPEQQQILGAVGRSNRSQPDVLFMQATEHHLQQQLRTAARHKQWRALLLLFTNTATHPLPSTSIEQHYDQTETIELASSTSSTRAINDNNLRALTFFRVSFYRAIAQHR